MNVTFTCCSHISEKEKKNAYIHYVHVEVNNKYIPVFLLIKSSHLWNHEKNKEVRGAAKDTSNLHTSSVSVINETSESLQEQRRAEAQLIVPL